MNVSRRTVVQGLGGIAASSIIPLRMNASAKATDDALLTSAIHSAMDAGAEYADARWTHTFSSVVSVYGVSPSEHIAIGVRAFVNGNWGFTSTSICDQQEIIRIGEAATLQAKIKVNRTGADTNIDLSRFQTAAINEQWIASIKIDPFNVYPYEIQDYLKGLVSFMGRFNYVRRQGAHISLVKQVKTFANSYGARISQTCWRTGGSVRFTLGRGTIKRASIETISESGLGLEYFLDQDIRGLFKEKYEEILADVMLPLEPVDVGRYPVLVNAGGVAGLLGGSIGCATELDRILGMEANSVGSSYIQNPQEDVGRLKIGSPLLNVTADRSSVGGIATVGWDDDGMKPRSIAVIDKGILSGLQTNLELNSHIRGSENNNSGASNAADATAFPLITSGNLAMKPAEGDATFESMAKDLEDGIILKDAGSAMDFQLASGLITGDAYRVREGKVVARMPNVGVLFRTSELWNSLARVGGKNSVHTIGLKSRKGEPEQDYYFSVTAGPAVFEDATVIDTTRK